ncbi:MAG: GNAT family N-acetyltransferase [Betaproteobacteria bacterium]|nr:GNAT family N-acetyltransferase [Betaproteobacteria bacterium]MDH5221036.1 GNAT family N-acetyltransferase [Betaproteobacteria bacterium]MDH5349411.1 GNAT family N-acetyltransferase [Betaproteobacteria bacterium]
MQIVTRELRHMERAKVAAHLRRLDAEDRRLRFGLAVADAAIDDYVARIDFDRDAVFGVFDDALDLAGAAHLARGDDQAELGVSVLPACRGRGVGAALLARAHLHARNWGIGALFMHCLAENAAMVHLARKQGMRIVSESGEADAHLALPPADAASFAQAVLDERVGLFDYALKSQFDAVRRLMLAGAGAVAPSGHRP